MLPDFARAQRYYACFASWNRVDSAVFCCLIEGASCDNGSVSEESLVARIAWMEREMEKRGALCTGEVWRNWLFLAKRSQMKSVTRALLLRIEAFMEKTKYFEFDGRLLQSVVLSGGAAAT